MRNPVLLAATALALTASPVAAQNTIGDRLGQILGNLLGVGNQAANSLEGQWTANRRPLGDQRYAFEQKIDADVSAGLKTSATAARLKSDYYALTQLEASYGTDGTFTTAERADLTARYNALLKVLTEHRYPDTATTTNGTPTTGTTAAATIAAGQEAFDKRVDAQVAKLKISRTAAYALKDDYAELIRVEAGYLSDGVISASERSDLNARADALDVRVGDVGYKVTTPVVVTPTTRLAAIATAIPKAGFSTTARAQIWVEHGDLTRLAQAYAKFTPTTDEKAYLERRLADLEKRAKVKR